MLALWRLFLIFVLAAIALFTSCGNDRSQARFLMASTSPPKGIPLNLDIAIDGKTQATGLTFGNLVPTTGYLTLTAGTRRVEARDTGTTTDDLNFLVAFASGKQYTMLVVGRVVDKSLALLQKTDDNSAPPSGKIKLRVIHCAPLGPAFLDIYIVAPGTDITNLAPTISGLGYQQASNYEVLAAGSYEVIMVDTTDHSKKPVDKPYDLGAGEIRTLVTVDDAADLGISDTPLVLSDLN